MGGQGGLKRNVTSNFAGYVVNILIAFVVSPLIIRTVGDARYGVWALVAQITGYYGLLDIGIRGAITHYTARHLALKESEQVKATLASGFWFLAAIGMLALAAGVAIAILFPHIFRLNGVDVDEARTAMLIMSGMIALNLPMATLSGVLVGRERLDLSNGIEIVTRVAGAVAIYLVMKQGRGLVALALIQVGMTGGRWLLTYGALRRIGGEVGLSPRYVSRSAFRALAGYGSRSMVINLAMIIVNQTDLVVIGMLISTTAVTIYAIGQMLITYMAEAGAAVAYSFTPRLTHIASRGDDTEVRRVYLMGARTAGTLVAPLAGCVLAFGPPFLAVWLGPEYVTGDIRARSDVVMYILLAAQTPRILQQLSWQLMFATRRQGYLARISVLEAALNIALSVMLGIPFGIIGVALGTLIPLSMTHLFLLPRYISRTFGITPRDYFVGALGRPILIGAGLFALGTALTRAVAPHTWPVFLVEAAITGSAGLAAIFWFGLNHDERRRAVELARGVVGRSA